MTPAALQKQNRTRILLAFAAVYFVWGSTYLFIKYAVESIPPFLLGAVRFVLAGLILDAVARWRRAGRSTASQMRTAAVTGILMLTVGNGAVIWAVQFVPSGVVALIVATVPLWIALFDWVRPRGVRPRNAVFVGLALGLAGIVALIGPGSIVGSGQIDAAGAAVLLVGSMSWALGSIVTRSGNRPHSPLVTTAIQMFAAGLAFVPVALLSGELGRLSTAAFSAKSLISVAYLVFGGSLLGFTAYVYLLGKVSAAKAATYAYVNPVVAVLLGWAFANESISGRTIGAAAVILAGVALITATQSSASTPTGEHPVPGNRSMEQRPAA